MTTRATEQRRAEKTFPPDVTSAGAARRFVASVLADWSCDHLREDAVLLVSELVTNACIHADSHSTVVVTATDDGVRIEVHDSDQAHPPVQQPMSTTAVHGRGLLIVDRVATDWASERTTGGKVVWFVLDDA